MGGPSGDAYRKALFSKKGFFVHISSENGGALEPESENTFRLQSPSVLLRDMNEKALFWKKGLCDMHRRLVLPYFAFSLKKNQKPKKKITIHQHI